MSTQVKVGDYIEGYEFLGANTYSKIHKTRIVVSNIIKTSDGLMYEGRADDQYGGTRGTCIRGKLGKIRVVIDEKPFTKRWWENQQMAFYTWERTWNPNDIVRKDNGEYYRILNLGVNTDTLEQYVVYTNLENTKLFVEPREVFEQLSEDSTEQVFKFETVKNLAYQTA